MYRYIQLIDRKERYVELSDDATEGSGERVSFDELRASWRWADGVPGPDLSRPESFHPFDCLGYPLELRPGLEPQHSCSSLEYSLGFLAWQCARGEL